MDYFPGLSEMVTIHHASLAGVGTIAELHRTMHDGTDMSYAELEAYMQISSIFNAEYVPRKP